MNDVVRTHVLLPRDLVKEIDRRVGPRRRSEFLARAARRELDVEERLRLFDEFVGSMKGKGIPAWETPEAAAAWVREQRAIDHDPWQDNRSSDDRP